MKKCILLLILLSPLAHSYIESKVEGDHIVAKWYPDTNGTYQCFDEGCILLLQTIRNNGLIDSRNCNPGGSLYYGDVTHYKNPHFGAYIDCYITFIDGPGTLKICPIARGCNNHKCRDSQLSGESCSPLGTSGPNHNPTCVFPTVNINHGLVSSDNVNGHSIQQTVIYSCTSAGFITVRAGHISLSGLGESNLYIDGDDLSGSGWSTLTQTGTNTFTIESRLSATTAGATGIYNGSGYIIIGYP